MYDFAIVGGGIVGLSTGMALSRYFPNARILVLEKEASWAEHQSGRNSGVIHSGIYYKPGSLKAKFACRGNRSMVSFCQEHGIEHEICGKVIVAANEQELPLLDQLYDRGINNGLQIRKLTSDELKEIEPHVSGIAAIKVPSAGIVNYKKVCAVFAKLIEERGGDLKLQCEVHNIAETGEGVKIETNLGSYQAGFLINCAGLHCDRIARICGIQLNMRIIPFRGEYYKLKPESRHLVNHLVYPVPNPSFPFLGVHFTRMIDGQVEAGPNAVLSLKREGYKKTSINLKDLWDISTYPGFWKLAARHWKQGLEETSRSLSKAAFVRSLQQLIPDITADDLEPAAAGVRAQAINKDGTMADDFHIQFGRKSIHVCNAPSPAATASIEIGNAIASQIYERRKDS